MCLRAEASPRKRRCGFDENRPDGIAIVDARFFSKSAQCPDNFGGPVDLRRIELLSPQCECGALPLDHRPTKIIEDPRFIEKF